MKTLSTPKVYKVALTAEKTENELVDCLNIIVKIQTKLKQIAAYCKTYKIPVVVYISENVPHVFYSFLFSQGFTLKPVVTSENEVLDGNTIQTKNINNFIDTTCEYVMIICNKENADDFDFEIPNKFFYIVPDTKKGKRLTPDPALTLREAHQNIKQKADPYSVFYHELLYEVKPFNYYDEIMQTMPDNNALTNREFANANKKP